MATTRQRHCGRDFQGSTDGCAVETVALARVLQEFVSQWAREHPDLAGQKLGNTEARRVLRERTVRAASRTGGQGVSEKTIRRVLAGRSRFTELRTADALVTAARISPQVFYDGSLPVVPNPHAAPGDRASCCGGGLNGSLGFQPA